MNLTKTISNFFSGNERAANCFMKGYATDEAVEFMDSNQIDYNEVDSYGGEDCGSTYYRVYCFQNNAYRKNMSKEEVMKDIVYNYDKPSSEKVYIKFNGWYASHYGSEYRDFEIVTPKQRTVTVYE